MIDAKKAVSSAANYLQELYPGISDVLLEEIDRTQMTNDWLITLSFVRIPTGSPVTPQGTIAQFFGDRQARHYKVFTIDAETGDVISMKIRGNA